VKKWQHGNAYQQQGTTDTPSIAAHIMLGIGMSMDANLCITSCRAQKVRFSKQEKGSFIF
jgi:hypothetical protein